jgi:hypothetical protein
MGLESEGSASRQVRARGHCRPRFRSAGALVVRVPPEGLQVVVRVCFGLFPELEVPEVRDGGLRSREDPPASSADATAVFVWRVVEPATARALGSLSRLDCFGGSRHASLRGAGATRRRSSPRAESGDEDAGAYGVCRAAEAQPPADVTACSSPARLVGRPRAGNEIRRAVLELSGLTQEDRVIVHVITT